MSVTCGVWRELTKDERLEVLKFASEQNRLRWEKRKAALMAT